jgi:type IV fimbrial biogenesis protein FimT
MNMEREKGFTLIELMITIIVVSILLATGVPSFLQFIKNNRITSQANNLVVSIQVARSEAVKRNTNTIICASTDQATCSADADDWASGWIVFSDFNQDGDTDVGADTTFCEDTEDCIIRSNASLSGNTSMSIVPATTHTLRFLPTGLAANGGQVTITLEADNCTGKQKRDILITPQGHTTVSKVNC